MENEIWKDIPNYEGYYQVSNLGRVKSLSRTVKHSSGSLMTIKDKIMTPTSDGRGYLTVRLTKNDKGKTWKIHKLLGIAFLGNKPDGTTKVVVDHIDNNQLNNRLDNLQLITQRLNVSKDKQNGTSKYTGVFWDKDSKKWRPSIKINGKTTHLGSYDNEVDASKAYKKALNELSIHSSSR